MLEKYLPRIKFESYEDFKANYRVDVPDNFNFGYDIVDGWAKAQPDKRALVWCDDHSGEKTLTFSDVSRLSNKAANMLINLGIKKGDAVMLILRRRYEYWIIATALHKIGAVVVPASLQLTAKDISYRAKAADIKLMICVCDDFVNTQTDQSEFNGMKMIVAGGREGWLSFDRELEKYPDTLERRINNKSNDLMLMYFTSGTTGMPKMVRHTFEHPLGQVVTAKYWQQVQEDKLHMSVSDSGWAKFGWGKIYGQWICGSVIFAYDMDKFVPKLLLEKIQQYRVTTFCAPPTMYRFILQEDLTKYDLSNVKHCCNAGEPLNPEVYRRFYELTGLKLTEGFGQSESSVMVANFEWYEPRPGSMGKPSPLYDIDLLDANGASCPPGVEGELIVRGFDDSHPCGLFYGYHNDPEYTLRAIHDGIYYTGDVAWRDDDGYYWFVGRNDDVIKCSGYRIGPFEVESALLEHKDVVECAVTAVPDPVRGQVVKATIILRDGIPGTPELIKELQEHVKRLTAPYKYPRIIEFVSELPKTVSGKIKRKQIRDEDAAVK